MRLHLVAIGLLAAVSCTLGCVGDAQPGVERDGDAATYATETQGVVDRHCGFEACHGREGMPLVLYAHGFLRLRDPEGRVDPTLPPLDERALTEAELELNRRALAARTSADDPQGDAMIRRLIPIEQGGIPHGDVVVFLNPMDADLAALRRFLGTVRAIE